MTNPPLHAELPSVAPPNEAHYDGRTVGKLGLMATLWLDPRAAPAEVWTGLLRAAEAFSRLAGPHLGWWSSTIVDEVSWLSTMAINSQDEELSEDSAGELLAALHDTQRKPFSAAALEGGASRLATEMLELALGSGRPAPPAWRDVLDWMFYANLPVQDSEVSGFVRIHMPAPAGGSSREAGRWLREFMRGCVQVLPVLHGSGGWAVQLPLSYRYFQANLNAAVALFDLVRSHAGIDVYDPAEMAIEFTHKTYTVNWLNYLGDALRQGRPLQGDAACETSSSAVTPERLGAGHWIQAGAQPELFSAWLDEGLQPGGRGERAVQDEAFESYRAAAAVLRPWRRSDADNECIAPPPYGFADTARWQAACRSYLTRFD